jgi:hypothetical protein
MRSLVVSAMALHVVLAGCAAQSYGIYGSVKGSDHMVLEGHMLLGRWARLRFLVFCKLFEPNLTRLELNELQLASGRKNRVCENLR